MVQEGFQSNVGLKHLIFISLAYAVVWFWTSPQQRDEYSLAAAV